MSTVVTGFYGKLPARGDFVRVALPRDFTDPWDTWLAGVIAASRAEAGEDWLPAYLESPVWRFLLPAGTCGSRTAIGLMLPSVDRAGRYFPLSFAALLEHPSAEAAAFDTWLDRCEAAGLAALDEDLSPEAIAARLNDDALRDCDGLADASPSTHWWTAGAPRVAATRISLQGMPDATTYARMLGALPAEESPATGGGDGWENSS